MLAGATEVLKRENKKVREVDRQAEVGEYIKIVKARCSRGCYKSGDILKVYKEEDEWRGVYCELKKKLHNTGYKNDNGNIIIQHDEYVVLENYKPKKSRGQYVN